MYIPSKKRITSLFSHLVCALLILFTSQVVAQTIYPIRSIATLAGSAPYTLDEYVSQEGKLQVQIITDDVTLTQYAVKLRLTLESADVKITTSTSYLPQPIYLEGGMMEIFTATDLAPLFSVNNLTFEGAITKSQYQKVGKLPEGTYRIKVDVVDYYRNVVVSKTTSAIGMVYMTKAPKLSFPASGSEIDIATSPQVRFNWMTFHAINPDAEIVHRFRIWELQPANRNPYEIINAITPIYQEDVTLGANLTLSPDILLLIPGRTYVWQVQAVDLQNKVLYQNSGKSDAFTFRYGKSCITPLPTLLKVGTTETQIGWSGNINTQQYEVRYKIATDTDWKLATTKLANYTILAQTDNTNYQVNVTAVCGTEQSAPSQTLEFKTNRTVDYTCGTGAAQFDLSNKTPLPALVKYDEFKAADFIIEVTEATGSNGQFTGKGLALVPYLGFAKFKVEFDDITINTDRRMVAGEVRFVYDVATGMVVGLGASGTQAKEIVATDYLKDQYSQIITTTQEVKKVEVKDSTVTITLADGSTQKVTASKKGDAVAIITPSNTTAYVADTNSGMVYTSPLPGKSEASSSASVASASQTKQYGSSVTITPSKTQQFGFDVVGNGTDKPNSYFLKNKSAQAVAWKSLKAGANDYVDVTATGASIDSLRYLRESGMATPSTALPKGRQLLLTGSADGEEELLTVALSTTKMGKDSTIKQTLTELGALGLVSYDPLVREVIIVPVNAAQAPSSSSAIQTTLNTIFAPAVVSWKVTMASPITVTGITPEGFSTTNLSLASRYTTDMKTVIKAYKATNNISSNTLVLFFVTATNADKLGYMPLTGNYGFIFKLGSNIELLAHELSHGAFNLKHTFSDISFWRESGAAPVFKEKSTHNLMDYAGGTELWKYQWDLIHDPEMVVMGSLDEDEGAAFRQDGTVALCINDVEAIKALKEYKLFYLPDGQKVDLSTIDLTAGGFYGADDKTPGAPGSLFTIKKNNNDHFFIFNQVNNSAIGFGFPGLNALKKTVKVEDINFTDNAKIPYRVYINKTKGIIDVKQDDKLINTIKFNGNCDCNPPYKKIEAEPSWVVNDIYIDGLNEVASKEAIDKEVANAAEILNKHLSSNSGANVYNEQQYKHIINPELAKTWNYGDVTTNSLMVLEHKLKYLSEFSEQKGKKVDIYVLFYQSGILLNDFNAFAQAVYEKSNIGNLNSNSILITVPLTIARTSGLNNEVRAYHMPGYHMGTSGLIDESKLQSKNGYKSDNLIHFISSIYRATYKPSKRYIGFVEFLGVHFNVDESKTFESGRDGCKEIVLLKKPEFDAYNKLLPAKNGSTTYGGGVVPVTNYYSTKVDLLNYELEKAELIEAAKSSEWIKYEGNDLVQIKEPFITDNIAINYILNYATKGSFCQWSSELYSVNPFNKEFTALDEFKIDPSQTYNLSFWKTIDPIVYGVVDVSSIPLSFIGCDFISDGVGLLYAIPRGNIENSATYSASFVMVAVSGGTIKVAKQLVSESYGVTRIIASNMVNGRAITESVAAFRLKKMLTLAEDANIADDVLLSFAQLSKNGEISVAQIEKITDAATSPEDKIKYIREAVEEGSKGTGKLLNAEGKFIDNLLEADYAKYLTRKAAQGKTPRGRLDWKEASDYFKYNSPIARGNAFNKKAEQFYNINELNLKVDGKNVRVDSYVPPKKNSEGKLISEGKIISRKATDLEDIDIKTFEGYLKEMKKKYYQGAKIRSDVYPNLDGEMLEGKQYLQIPESNKSFSQIQDYIKLANDNGIEIIFLAE